MSPSASPPDDGRLGTRLGPRHCAWMPTLETLVGFVAAVCTTVSYFPQVWKCWQTGSSGDLSLRMLLILSTGIGLWVLYGILKGDMVIILANFVSLMMLCTLLVFKVKGTAREKRLA
jgi:MtN3 and saliva related transmembrane protein